MSSFLSALTASTAATTSSTSSSTSSSSSTSDDTSSTSDAFDNYISVLLAQLQSQDPTDPTDTGELTQAIASAEQVQLQSDTNSLLTTLVDGVTSLQDTLSASSDKSSYLGTDVVAEGSTAPLQDGEAEWYYTLGDTASSVALTVTDADGNVVYETTGETAAGSHSFTWDGSGSDGASYDEGEYDLTVTALDSGGAAIDSSVLMTGRVNAIDYSGDSATLYAGNVAIDPDDVEGLLEAA